MVAIFIKMEVTAAQFKLKFSSFAYTFQHEWRPLSKPTRIPCHFRQTTLNISTSSHSITSKHSRGQVPSSFPKTARSTISAEAILFLHSLVLKTQYTVDVVTHEQDTRPALLLYCIWKRLLTEAATIRLLVETNDQGKFFSSLRSQSSLVLRWFLWPAAIQFVVIPFLMHCFPNIYEFHFIAISSRLLSTPTLLPSMARTARPYIPMARPVCVSWRFKELSYPELHNVWVRKK